MAGENEFDVVVIGGGPGGYIAAIRAGQLGLKTACIEGRGALGGTCLNVGCIPSKALLQSSEMLAQIQHKSASHGIQVAGVSLDLGQMMKRKREIVAGLTKGVEGLFKKNKVTYVKGWGRFLAATRIAVRADDGSEKELIAKNVIIATGSEPVELGKIAPFDGERVVSSTEALSFSEVPKRLVVIGGGVIGLEMGSVWSRLGSEVTVVEALPRILAGMDGQISTTMTKILEQQGFKFLVGTKLQKVDNPGKGTVTVHCDRNGEKLTLEADKVLVAVGRRAYTKGLGLETIGVKTNDRGVIEVDPHFRTNVTNVYAIGDVIPGPMLAHKAEDEGVACAEIIAGKPGHVNYANIPGVVYTWPEVAAAGLTEEDCKEKGIKYRTGQFPFMANGRARCLGDTDGFVKVVADERSDRILGVHMVGPQVSELIAEMVVALEFGASSEDIARTVHAHPTLSEVVKEACLAVDKRTLSI